MFKWTDNLRGIDRLSAGALAAVVDLRRIGARVIADRERGDLFIENVARLTPDLTARAQRHAAEIIDLVYSQPRPGREGDQHE